MTLILADDGPRTRTHVSNACNAQTLFTVARLLLLVLVALPVPPVLSLVLVSVDREGCGHHVLSQEAKALCCLAPPHARPFHSYGFLWTQFRTSLYAQLCIFVNFSPVCLFSAGRKQRDRQGHTKSQPGTDKIICYTLCFVLAFQFLFGCFCNYHLLHKESTRKDLKGEKNLK